MRSAEMARRIPRALTIAGSDSGGGAGIQADLKTFVRFGVYGMSAITSLTAQNTQGVFEIEEVSPAFVYHQIKAVVWDIGVDAAKTGMLPYAELVLSVAKAIRDFNIEKLVVDPVIEAKTGDKLIKDHALEAIIQEILPKAYVITPNLPEAEALAQMSIQSVKDMEKAARIIAQRGAKIVVVKGGHLPQQEEVVDVIYDGEVERLRYPYIQTQDTHGTGCTFSAAITACLAKGYGVRRSIAIARAFIQGAIENAWPLGDGFGPVNQNWIS